MIGGFAIHGHAIVSADDRIADSTGYTPVALRNDADWARFQAALDAAVLTVLGRRGHEANPNRKKRNRLVLSSSANRIERRDDGWWWNPADVPFADALAVAVPRELGSPHVASNAAHPRGPNTGVPVFGIKDSEIGNSRFRLGNPGPQKPSLPAASGSPLVAGTSEREFDNYLDLNAPRSKPKIVCVPGGRPVFDLFLSIGFDAFHLARADRVTIPDGIPVFSDVIRGRCAADILADHGLVAEPTEMLDAAERVTLTVWRRLGFC